MINVSWISEYSYCPLKLYLKQVMGEDEETPVMTMGNIQHELRRGYEEITKRNLWHLEEHMSVKEISEILYQDVPELVEHISDKYRETGLMDFLETGTCISLKEDLKLDSCLTALKVKKIMKWSRKSSLEVADILFPSCLIEFYLKNKDLQLKGKVDKIELLEGHYYPVEVKSGRPPVKGVWKGDALQTAAYALLIEEEFKREVLVGFVDYVQIADRRTVVLNNPLIEELYTVLNEMQSILNSEYVPELVQNPNKCKACDYADFCEYCNA